MECVAEATLWLPLHGSTAAGPFSGVGAALTEGLTTPLRESTRHRRLCTLQVSAPRFRRGLPPLETAPHLAVGFKLAATCNGGNRG